jgi:hypothetical protein
LLDGFDEVALPQRPRVAQEIRDLLIAYPRCQVVMTCRAAIYDQGLRDDVDRTFQVADFNNDSIRRFLDSWPGLPTEAAGRLMRALRASPRIMALARNPLLLTLIAYLYADEHVTTDRRLPRSRSDFYKEATDVLLYRWRQNQNVFSRPEKRAVLERLALWSQHRRVGEASLDMPYADVLSEIAEVLPSLNRARSEARAILDEIVEHSALLHTYDAGEHYQFSHLTMQEYFAACAMYGDPAGLVQRFIANPDAWREPLLLWCGEARDASTVITEVYAADPVTALECLDSAQRVDPDLAQRIIADFRDRLINDSDDSAVAFAFGAIAAHGTPRARVALGFLMEALDGRLAKDSQGVAYALAATGLPEAAEILGTRFTHRPEARSALIHMGDVAVPVLGLLAAQGSTDAVDALQAIGSPAAARALVPLLWERDSNAKCRYFAAWRLAVLVKDSSVESALATYPIAPEQEREPYLHWHWEPFVETDRPNSLLIIGGRIGYLLDKCPISMAPIEAPSIDPRISVALLTVAPGKPGYHSFCRPALHADDRQRLRRLHRWDGSRYPGQKLKDGKDLSYSEIGLLLRGVHGHQEEQIVLIDHLMRHFLTDRRHVYLFTSLTPELRLELGRRMLIATRWLRPVEWSRSIRKARDPEDLRTAAGISQFVLLFGVLGWAAWDLLQVLTTGASVWTRMAQIAIFACMLLGLIVGYTTLKDTWFSVIPIFIVSLVVILAFSHLSDVLLNLAGLPDDLSIALAPGLMILSIVIIVWSFTRPISLAALLDRGRRSIAPVTYPTHLSNHPAVGHHDSQ